MTGEKISGYKSNSFRLKQYDYTQPGTYFITICTYARICFLGEIKDGKMLLNEYGKTVNTCWLEIPRHFPFVTPAPFVVMPNHIHGIIIISRRTDYAIPSVETRHAVSSDHIEAYQKPVVGSLPTIVRSFKAAATKRLNKLGNYLPVTIWQRNYYEHVIRHEKELSYVIEYIESNPSKWMSDENYIENMK
jgi:putative transposase